ncbi:GIY-YIG nuclease family protein [Jejudonia soesokkakensis]|uniref:GIY-YIG nuclease family protein n=1 Tax=Jejudonia soesokkakensis TaxID=1323432 RepID=A0ABW2MT81_9FLAO
MEEYLVYILASDRTDKLYKGYTSDLISRFASHNEMGIKGWTMRYRPWRVVFVRFFSSKRAAIEFEKFLKTGKGREWIKKNNIV